jgi:hypothetical protein
MSSIARIVPAWLMHRPPDATPLVVVGARRRLAAAHKC